MILPSTAQSLYTQKEWLDANTMGRVTPEQEALLKKPVPWIAMLASAATVIFLVIITAPLLLLLTKELGMLGVALIGLGLVLLPAAGIYLNHAQMRQRVQRALESQRLGSGYGQVHFKNTYQAEVDGKPLRALKPLNLPPGEYQFYYLEDVRILLSASPRTAQPEVGLLQTLQAVLNFDEDDLAANRRGELSERQRGRLLRTTIFAGALALALLLGGAALLGQMATLIMLALFILVFAAMAVGWAFKSWRDLNSAVVLAEAGRGERLREVRRSGRSSHVDYFYLINGKRFQVKQRAYEAIITGLRYRAYAATSGRLLSIEPLKEDG